MSDNGGCMSARRVGFVGVLRGNITRTNSSGNSYLLAGLLAAVGFREPLLQERLDGLTEAFKVCGLLDVGGRSQLEAARAFPLFRRTTEDDNGGRLIGGELANLRQ